MNPLKYFPNILFVPLITLLFSFTLIKPSFPQESDKVKFTKSTPHLNGEVEIIHINNIYLPFENNGSIANVNLPVNERGGQYDNGVFLFASGFYLSGLTNDQLWANGVAASGLLYDYLPGNYDIGSNDPRAIIYVVNSDDIVFGQSWQDWRDAVDLGADFYDGDGDGVYNPVDINSNGEWEPNEDMPDLLGDRTLWCVFYDNVPANQRRWITVEPQGIEIRQTAFAYAMANGSLSNTIFIRYRIRNTGLLSSKLDSVYFTSWADADIGEPFNDLDGSDTTLNSGYTYDSSTDPIYGDQPPTFLIDQLAGPVHYIPGETFIDKNGNGEYDEGIDTPLDTAKTMRGQRLGIQVFPGAKNLEPSSFVEITTAGAPNLDFPNNKYQARNYMLGYDRFGNIADPCTWPFGEVMGGVNCNTVNPFYWYSGDPITNIGWICTYHDDQRMLLNVGPFELKEGEDKEIFIAYIVGQGTTPLGAIPVAREWSRNNQIYYDNNFDITVSDVYDDNLIVSDFQLYQNYPNPFNPATQIKFALPESGNAKLTVFDVLGNEMETLVNGYFESGTFEYYFDASNFSSGIYFYTLQFNNSILSKKMILLK
jgi:hypothetical protein